MDKIESEVADASLPRYLDMRVVIWRLLELHKCVWDDLTGYENIREIYTPFIQKSWDNKAWILEETDHEDRDVISSSLYNTIAMLWRLLML